MKKSRYILPVLVALTCCLWPEAAAAADMTQTGRIAAEAAAVDKITVTQEVTVDPAAALNIREATPSQSGLMSPAQAAQLEAMAVGGGGGISAESDPVYSAEKAAIYAALDERVMESDIATYAPLDSPALTGSPTTTEPPADSDDQTIATTSFVRDVVGDAGGGGGGVAWPGNFTDTEVDTGSKWIDGRTIYRRTFVTSSGTSQNSEIIIAEFGYTVEVIQFDVALKYAGNASRMTSINPFFVNGSLGGHVQPAGGPTYRLYYKWLTPGTAILNGTVYTTVLYCK